MNGIVAPAVVVGVGGVTAAAWAGVRRRHRRPETLVERLLRRMETSGPDQGSPPVRPGSPEESGDDAA